MGPEAAEAAAASTSSSFFSFFCACYFSRNPGPRCGENVNT